MSVRPSSAATIALVFIIWLNLCFVRPREARETGVQPYGAGVEGPDKEVVRFSTVVMRIGELPEPSPGPWSCHGRPSHGRDTLRCGGCGAMMLPRYPGDWLSGRAPRSHRGGHWFDPSIAHGPATAARRSLIGFAEGRDTFRGPSPRTPTIGGTGRRSASRLVQLLAPGPRNWWYRSAISFPFGSASRPRTPAIGGTGRLFGFCPGGPRPRTPTICGCGPVFGFCPVGRAPRTPQLVVPVGSLASGPSPSAPQLVVAVWG